MRTSNYVGLNGRLTQAWLNAPLVILIIMIVKLCLLRSFIMMFLQTAQKAVVSECNSLETAYEAAAKAPQTTINVANQLITASVNNAIQQSKKAISGSLTLMENLVSFAFEMSLGTYSCLAISAVNIGANEAINATQATLNLANEVAGDVGKEINSGLNKLSKFINGAVGLISSVESYFNEGNSQIKNISLSVNKLNNLTLPVTKINDKLESFRTDIPTYKGTKDFIKKEVSVPFSLLQKQLNSSNFTVQLSVPMNLQNENQLVESLPVCNFTSVDDSFRVIRKSVSNLTVALCVLCGLAMLFGILYNLWHSNRRWNRMVQAALSEAPLAAVPEGSSLEEITMSRFAYMQSNFFERMLIVRNKLSPNQLWWLRYVTMRPLVDFLVVGLVGFIVSLLELILIAAAKKALHELKQIESSMVADMSKQTKAAFDTWRNQTNSNILNIQNNVNTQMLGWLYNGSQGLNNTLSHFSDVLNDDVAGHFNGTMLYEPLQGAIACLVGNKLAEVEKGLTWIHENSQVSLPKVSNNLTLQKSDTIKKMETTSVLVVQNALKYLYHSIHIQCIISGVLVGIWLVYALLACLRFHNFKMNWPLKKKSGTFVVGNSMKTTNLTFNEEKENPFIGFAEHRSSISKPPPSLEKVSTNGKFDYSIMSWNRDGNTSFDFRHKERPSSIIIPELDTVAPETNKSPIQRIHNRITQMFKGPNRNVELAALKSPARGSIHLADDPATPLKAMIFY